MIWSDIQYGRHGYHLEFIYRFVFCSLSWEHIHKSTSNLMHTLFGIRYANVLFWAPSTIQDGHHGHHGCTFCLYCLGRMHDKAMHKTNRFWVWSDIQYGHHRCHIEFPYHFALCSITWERINFKFDRDLVWVMVCNFYFILGTIRNPRWQPRLHFYFFLLGPIMCFLCLKIGPKCVLFAVPQECDNFATNFPS